MASFVSSEAPVALACDARPRRFVNRVHSPRTEWSILLLLCCVTFAQLFLKSQQLSPTADESTHLYAGFRYYKCHDRGFGYEHPPLAKLVASAPLLGMQIETSCAAVPHANETTASVEWLHGNDWKRALFRARIAVGVFALGTCILIWLLARAMFGLTAAIIAATLMAFEPNMLAHGGLVTTDMVLTFTFLLTLYAFHRWLRQPSWLNVVFTGVATGLTLIAKHSGVIILPILVLLTLVQASTNGGWRRPRRLLKRIALQLAMIFLTALAVIWAGYGFHYSGNPDGKPISRYEHIGRSPQVERTLAPLEVLHLVPEPYFRGVGEALGMAQRGGPTGAGPIYILGKFYPRGQWFFFPLVLLIKLTIPFFVLAMLAVWSLWRTGRKYRRELLFLIVPATIYLAASMMGHMNSGVRHILPVIVLLLLLLSAGCAEFMRQRRWAAGLVVILLIALHAATSLHAFPYYGSYANELWGGSANLYRHLPNTDWGEADLAVVKYMRQYKGTPCWIMGGFQTDPRDSGVPCQPVGYASENVPPRMRGIVFVSSTFLRSPLAWPNQPLSPFADLKPAARLAGSAMLVYHGDFDTSSATMRAEIMESSRAMHLGSFETALQHATRAVELAPMDVDAREIYCKALVASNRPTQAVAQCNVAWLLLLGPPSIDSSARTAAFDAVQAETLIAQGFTTQALELAEKAVEIAPQNGALHLTYSRALLAVGQDDAADRHYREALRFLPINPVYRNRKSLAYGPSVDRLDEVISLLYAATLAAHGPEETLLAKSQDRRKRTIRPIISNVRSNAVLLPFTSAP